MGKTSHEIPDVPQETILMLQSGLMEWYRREKRDLPWRREPTPYHVAVSELMCQQTQIATVLPYYARWMKLFPDWRSLAAAPEEKVLKAWEGLGYYRRARMLHGLAKAVVETKEGELPDEVDALMGFPGIGRYTAGAIASIAFGKKAALVDGNVERVLTRIFNLHWDVSLPKTRNDLFVLAEKLLPGKNCGDFNQSLMELGARICSPRKPACILCPVRKICLAQDPESLPVKKRETSIAEEETLAVIEEKGKVWLSLPVNPKRWKGSYRLPHFDSRNMERGEVIGTHAYSITKYRIKAQVVSASMKGKLTEGKWFTRAEVEEIFLPAPHRKILEKVDAGD